MIFFSNILACNLLCLAVSAATAGLGLRSPSRLAVREMERTQSQAFAIQWLRPGYLVLSQQGKLRDDKQWGLVGEGDVYAFVR